MELKNSSFLPTNPRIMHKLICIHCSHLLILPLWPFLKSLQGVLVFSAGVVHSTLLGALQQMLYHPSPQHGVSRLALLHIDGWTWVWFSNFWWSWRTSVPGEHFTCDTSPPVGGSFLISSRIFRKCPECWPLTWHHWSWHVQFQRKWGPALGLVWIWRYIW